MGASSVPVRTVMLATARNFLCRSFPATWSAFCIHFLWLRMSSARTDGTSLMVKSVHNRHDREEYDSLRYTHATVLGGVRGYGKVDSILVAAMGVQACRRRSLGCRVMLVAGVELCSVRKSKVLVGSGIWTGGSWRRSRVAGELLLSRFQAKVDTAFRVGVLTL